ncbi:MAG: electron transport complex subunit RsxE [Phycisphaerales bacterium]|jgi:Na+-translocating ferredoxin:NAD+ oxidoreductase subunit E|nr:electron transport complex subunit RsxE [Phycisphaerales bacterium]MBT7170376.1 electron transport complex subunit RsxE [Phycisphaerales bacterium]
MPNDTGPTPMERFIQGILPENPVYRQLLGMCPVLAVTSKVSNAITMAAAVMFVLVCANILVSLIRNILQPHLRILVFTLTIATFVTIADKVLAAYLYPMSKQLGPYIPLIIVNCLIICRCEVCASKQGVVTATFDAVGQSLGFLLALVSMATVRELLAYGSWFDIELFWIAGTPQEAYRWGLMGMPPGAFFTLGVLLGVANWITTLGKKKDKASA